MKVSFEIARSAAKASGQITGAALAAPYPPDALRVRAQDVRDFQEFRALAERMNRTYDAASVDNFTRDFRGTFGSANAEMLPAKYAVRSRSRTLAKDTAHGKAVVRTFQNNVVGPDPFKLEMKSGAYDKSGKFIEDKEVNRAVEEAWRKFLKKKNFTTRKTMSAMESWRMVEASLIREGSVLCRKFRNFPFNEFGFAVDFLEEDRLQEQFNGASDSKGIAGPGNPIRASIEYHKQWGFPVAYWILTRHPGEFLSQTPVWADSRNKNYREQVPAEDIIHFNNLRDRAEQDIGMTELDSTVLPLWRIHQYDKSLTLSSIASAAKPWWLEQREPTGFAAPSDPATIYNSTDTTQISAPLGGGDPVSAQSGSDSPKMAVRPASRETLPPGYMMKQADPKFPIEAAHEFRLDNLRDIAVGAGISYQHASGDFQNLGFIAGLMCQIPFQDHCRVRQKNLIDGGIDNIFEEWLRSAVMIGYFDKVGVNISISDVDKLVESAHFKGRGWAFVNPLVQAQALILLNEAGHLTRQQVQNELPHGISVEKLFEEHADEEAEMEKLGLDFGEEIATEPGVNKEGTNAPGTPKPAEVEEGGAADEPPKSKAQSPRTRNRRLKIPMAELLHQSTNGT